MPWRKQVKRKLLLRTFRVRLLLSYFSLLGVAAICAIGTYLFIRDIQKLESFERDLIRAQVRFQSNYAGLSEALLSATKSESFYHNNGETALQKYLSNDSLMAQDLAQLSTKASAFNLNLRGAVDSVLQIQDLLSEDVAVLEHLLMQRGFRNMGGVGEMREFAHKLENSSEISKAGILQLRRHEKDFLLRNDSIYVKQFLALSDSLKQKLKIKNSNAAKADLALLKGYTQSFSKIVALETAIGFTVDGGVFTNIRSYQRELSMLMTRLERTVSSQLEQQRAKLMVMLLGTVALALLAIVVFSFWFSKRLTKDLTALGKRIRYFVKSGFKHEQEPITPSIYEVASINKDYNKLKSELQEVLERLEEEKQKAEQNSRYKSQFLANMSHEIRTPLNGVIGMVYHLHSTALSEEQEDFVNTLDFSANHLLNLVNLILDFSKIEAGKMELETVEFDLAADARKVMSMLKPKAQEKGIEFKLDIVNQNNIVLLGDSLRLMQVLKNLLNNALKFTEQGAVVLKIESIDHDEEFEQIRFEVKDTGTGIADDKKERLFMAFEQSDNSTTRKYGGTGLGLTISSQLIEIMGGRL